jgi:hypothetical protein
MGRCNFYIDKIGRDIIHMHGTLMHKLDNGNI